MFLFNILALVGVLAGVQAATTASPQYPKCLEDAFKGECFKKSPCTSFDPACLCKDKPYQICVADYIHDPPNNCKQYCDIAEKIKCASCPGNCQRDPRCPLP